MHTINKEDFTQLKEDLTAWLESCFDDNTETRYFQSPYLHKKNETDFFYNTFVIKIAISAVCNPESGEIREAFFDDCEIIDELNDTYHRHQINTNQTDQLNKIITSL